MIDNVKSKYENVLILTHYDTVTGGPEAMHQLSSTLNEIGCKSKMIYFSNSIEINGDEIKSNIPSNKLLTAYRKYDPKYVPLFKISENDLLIFPEIIAKYATLNINCATAIWWLSVDNAINWNSNLNYKNIPQPIFENKRIIHFYQSEYSHQYLIENKAKNRVPLYDYTNIEKIKKPQISKKYDIAIFPNKGFNLAKKFIEKERGFNYVQIINMTKEEVYETLSETHIYIDFGNQPGKDRVPREASICDCIIFLHRKGSADYYEDSPLDDFFLFTEEDIDSGNLGDRIRLALDNKYKMRSFQDYYKNKIYNEKKEFEFQCINFFKVTHSEDL